MVDPEFKRIERYIWGLPETIQGMVTASNPGTIQSAVRMAHSLMAQVVRRGKPTEKSTGDNKGKWHGNNQGQQQSNKKPETVKAYTSGSGEKKGYVGSKPYCSKCNRHHDGPCGNPCTKCKHYGYQAKDCRTPNANADPNAPKACFECGSTGHFRNNCPKRKNPNNNNNNSNNNNNPHGRAFVINAGEARQDPNVV